MDATTRRQLMIDKLLRDAIQVAYAHQLRRDFAAISRRDAPDPEEAFVITDFPPRPRRKSKGQRP